MKLEDRRKYLTLLMVDAQKARSTYLTYDHDEEEMILVAELEPWLFDEKKCMVPMLDKCLDGEPSNVDIINFSHMARSSQMLRIMSANSKRHDPEFDEIFKEE